jgi:hypothetical protein
MRKRDGGDESDSVLIIATGIACSAYCPEQWRLQYGLELESGNRAALDAGDRHHARKAAAERIAGGSITVLYWRRSVASDISASMKTNTVDVVSRFRLTGAAR